MVRLGQQVMHRGWHYTGRVVDFPFDDCNYLSTIRIVRDDTGVEEDVWLPAIEILLDEEEEIEWV